MAANRKIAPVRDLCDVPGMIHAADNKKHAFSPVRHRRSTCGPVDLDWANLHRGTHGRGQIRLFAHSRAQLPLERAENHLRGLASRTAF